MGDRLTLETADERDLWRASWLAYFHTSGITDRDGNPLAPVDVADQAVRAYRERLPASDDECARWCEECNAVLTPGQVLDGWTVHPDCERGPTEGASDAAFKAAAGAINEAVSWLLALGADSTQANAAAIEKLAAHTVREYAVERAGEIGQWAAHDDSAKLGTLIGAVKSTLDYRESAYRKDESWPRIVNGMARRLDAALDAAKGDAPTATPSRTTPAPQVPDSPGWSNLHDRALTVALQVERFDEGTGDWVSLNKATERLRETLKRGGRCTRGAPGRVDVEALRRLADSLDAPGTHSDAHAIRRALGDA